METLSVVAYLQPTTRAEVAGVRGVSSEWALGSLEERGLVEECGRADAPGSPILYEKSFKTTSGRAASSAAWKRHCTRSPAESALRRHPRPSPEPPCFV